MSKNKIKIYITRVITQKKIKTLVFSLKTRVISLKTRVISLKTRVISLKTRVISLKTRVIRPQTFDTYGFELSVRCI